jgi:cytoskeletal protein CcmA (bactofilin family)
VAAPKQKTVEATCPKCGHSQREPEGAYSTICKKCRSHFRLDEAPAAAKPAAAKKEKPAFAQRKVSCFQCGTELDVPVAAESTMCKRCSSHVDLRDYNITQTVSKNFRTYGRIVVEEKGYVLNTDSRVGEAVIKGRLIGKIIAERTLEIHSSAHIKGTINAKCLIVPAGHHFRWAEPLRIGGAEIGGELVANVESTGTVTLRASARLFGDIEAANLVIESGAVFVGAAKIGAAAGKSTTAAAATAPAPSPAPKRYRGTGAVLRGL